jgi:hypothetical protein
MSANIISGFCDTLMPVGNKRQLRYIFAGAQLSASATYVHLWATVGRCFHKRTFTPSENCFRHVIMDNSNIPYTCVPKQIYKCICISSSRGQRSIDQLFIMCRCFLLSSKSIITQKVCVCCSFGLAANVACKYVLCRMLTLRR